MAIVRCKLECGRIPKCILGTLAYTETVNPEEVLIKGEILPERKIVKSCALKTLLNNIKPID